jgi:hypothetical protein
MCVGPVSRSFSVTVEKAHVSTSMPRSRRLLRVPSPRPRQPVDRAKIGRSSVRRRATGMTVVEAAAALEEARLQQHIAQQYVSSA